MAVMSAPAASEPNDLVIDARSAVDLAFGALVLDTTEATLTKHDPRAVAVRRVRATNHPLYR